MITMNLLMPIGPLAFIQSPESSPDSADRKSSDQWRPAFGGCSVAMGRAPQPSSVRELVGSLFTAGEWIGDNLYKAINE